MARNLAQDFNPDGMINLAVAMVDDARTKYIKAIASLTYGKKFYNKDKTVEWNYEINKENKNVDEFYRNNKKLIHRWEVSRFVLNDPYSMFAPLSPEQVFRSWNKDAQEIVNSLIIKDTLVEKYIKMDKLSEVIDNLAEDITEYHLDANTIRKDLAPAFRQNKIRVAVIINQLKKLGYLPEWA